MFKGQLRGMQQHGIHLVRFFPELILFVASVRAIADNWMEDMSEMAA
jgi:hypothetical protein